MDWSCFKLVFLAWNMIKNLRGHASTTECAKRLLHALVSFIKIALVLWRELQHRCTIRINSQCLLSFTAGEEVRLECLRRRWRVRDADVRLPAVPQADRDVSLESLLQFSSCHLTFLSGRVCVPRSYSLPFFLCSDKKEVVIHSDDAFAPVGYLKLHEMHLEDKAWRKKEWPYDVEAAFGSLVRWEINVPVSLFGVACWACYEHHSSDVNQITCAMHTKHLFALFYLFNPLMLSQLHCIPEDSCNIDITGT